MTGLLDRLRDGEHERSVPECNGRCCEHVMIPRVLYGQLMRRPGKHDSGEELARMLVPVGSETRDGVEYLIFTCRNLDQATMRCLIYERRPQMCRTYPDGLPCRACGGFGTITT